MNAIATIILTNALAVGVVGFLLKLWIDKRLSHSLNLELERFRAELTKEVARDAIQQKWVNDKRMELLERLYEVMIDMEFEIKALFFDIKVQNKDFTNDRAAKVCEKYAALNAVLHKNEIFLSPSVIEEVRSTYRPHFDIAMECIAGGANVEDRLRNLLPNSLAEIATIVDGQRQGVVQAFRRSAGIDA